MDVYTILYITFLAKVFPKTDPTFAKQNKKTKEKVFVLTVC